MKAEPLLDGQALQRDVMRSGSRVTGAALVPRLRHLPFPRESVAEFNAVPFDESLSESTAEIQSLFTATAQANGIASETITATIRS